MGDSPNNRIDPDRERLGRMMLTDSVNNRVSGERERLGRMSLGGTPRRPKRNKGILIAIIVSALIIIGIAIIFHKHLSPEKRDTSQKDGTLLKSDEVSPILTDTPTPGIDVVGDATPTVEVAPDEYLVKSLEKLQTGMEQGEYKQVISGLEAVYCLRHDGTIEVFGCNEETDKEFEEIYADWKDIKSITLLPDERYYNAPESILGIKKDGSIRAFSGAQIREREIDLSEWKDIVWLTTWYYGPEVIGITSKGEMRSDGYGFEGAPRYAYYEALKGCSKVVYRAIDGEEVYGLTSAGKVLFCYGDGNFHLKCELSYDWDGTCWTDIADIVTNIDGCFALTKGGKVLCCWGRNECDKIYSEEVYNWSDVVSIAAGYQHIAVLKKDGTVSAVINSDYRKNSKYYPYYGQCDVGEWKNIVRIEAWNDSTVGYDSEGKVYFAGNNCLEEALSKQEK